MGTRLWIVGFIVVFTFSFSSCDFFGESKVQDADSKENNSVADQHNQAPEITFERTEHDFGKVIYGEVVSYNFKFKNTGDADLVISEVGTTCGCTVTNYPEKPIKPGEEKYLEVTFDSDRQSGFQSKTISIVTNAQPNPKTLRIKAKVVRQ